MFESDQQEEEKVHNPDGIIWIYTLGSLLALMLAFEDSLTPIKSTNCLFISWLFAIGALAISVLFDGSESAREEREL